MITEYDLDVIELFAEIEVTQVLEDFERHFAGETEEEMSYGEKEDQATG